MIYKKPENMKYTDMCIYIDNNMEYLAKASDPDSTIVENVYKYLYLIVYALSCKQKFFRDIQDYDDFSVITASILYMRIVDKRQYLPDGDPKKIKPIKSSLNYIKRALYGLKVNYQQENFFPTMHPKLYGEIETDTAAKEIIESQDADKMHEAIMEEFLFIPRKIERVIKRSPYRNNPVFCKNLYISLLLSFVDSITLTNSFLSKYNKRKVKDKQADTRLIKIYMDQQDNKPILYHLPESLSDYVKVLLNEVKKDFAMNLMDTKSAFNLSDDTIKNIIASIYTENDMGENSAYEY